MSHAKIDYDRKPLGKPFLQLTIERDDGLLLLGMLRLERRRFEEASNEVMVGVIDRVLASLEVAQGKG